MIVPAQDRPDMLREALASIRALEGPDLDLEVIVADNSVGREVQAVARSLGATWVPVARPGAAAARNAGMRVASGDYLAFLDDDDVWLPGHLRRHLRLLDSRPELAACVGQVQMVDVTLSSLGDIYPTAMKPGGDIFAGFLREHPQIGATVARAGVRDTVGYFDESLLGDADWDWQLRLALRHAVDFLPLPCLLFRQRPDGAGDEVRWKRVRYSRRVFRRCLRRGWRRLPAPHRLAKIYLAHQGGYAWPLIRSVGIHAAAGRPAEARRALWWAARISILHTVWALRRRELRAAVWYSWSGRRAR